MWSDFLLPALLAGIGVAAVAGPLGCFIVWRRMAYFGDTLAHAALLGIAVSFLLDTNPILPVFLLSGIVALVIYAQGSNTRFSADSLLGLLSHSTLAVGLVALSFITWTRVDLNSLLFGDILSVSTIDLITIYLGGGATLALLVWIWRPLFALTVNVELAQAEGGNPRRTELIFMVLLALIVAISIKIVGVLLITSLLIIPTLAARGFAKSPEMMAVMAALLGCLSVAAGLLGSVTWDTPSGPSIVVAALVIFLVSQAIKSLPSSASKQP